MPKKIAIYDTTLRDGTQMEGISFSVQDKLKITKKLIDFGVAFIEGGFPGSNFKDEQFFKQAQKLNWKNSQLVAFCSTRHKKNKPAKDPSLLSVLSSKVKFATIFGKTSALHVEKILGVSKQENLKLISDSISFLRSKNIKIIFDGEHFFDGFLEDQSYTLQCLKVAVSSGAFNLSLCDTNGGNLPWQIENITKKVKQTFPQVSIGIHAHNDSGLAEAVSLSAIQAGADLVQGTINGLGERTGNANLCTIIPSLMLKMNCNIQPNLKLKNIFNVANFVAEIANTNAPSRAPFVGRKAFVHKAGLHVSAVAKLPQSYEHINPELVGNSRGIKVSELSGKMNIVLLAKSVGIKIDKNSLSIKKILQEVKYLENQGFVFEGAEASFKLLILKMQGVFRPKFTLLDFLILNRYSRKQVEAEVQIRVGDIIQTKIAFGNGPVNALDKAIRSTLIIFFPMLKKVKLTDFKVRIINTSQSTGAKTRVLLESSNGKNTWTTVGCHENITKASLQALIDSFEFALLEKT